ncbi:MAG: isochorismatase family protein [Bacteroidales bacterium]|nr:isochorismatase family protein [Bacteroidales bacterium]
MKKQIFGAMMLVAALIMTGCGNNDDPTKKDVKNKKEVKVEKENRMLIIVDPQIDFTTGSLATAKGPEAMDRLAQAIDNGVLDKYTWVIVTQDAHPTNHCSFVDNGGVFPPHCVQGTEGMNVYPPLQKALEDSKFSEYHYMTKGDLADKEEFSIFQNAKSSEKLTTTIKEVDFKGIDICGIATDYCVYETTKDLMAIYPAKQIRIVTNCIAAVDENDTKLADLMKENGIEGITF